MLWVLLFLLIPALACAVTGWVMLCIGMRRRRRERTVEYLLSRADTPAAPYRAQMREGVAWARAQNPISVETRSFDGLRLSGLYFPAEGEPRARLLLFHGYRDAALYDFSCVLRFYHDLGCELLLVDQRSHGKSEGKYITFGILERYDCKAWAEFMNVNYGADVPTFLDGISMGATTVLLAAGEDLPENVRGVIADCGFSSAWEELAHVLKRDYHLPVFPFLHLLRAACRILAGFDIKDGDVRCAMERCTLPVLFLHGEADTFVPCWMSRACHAACRGEKRLLTIPGAAHGMSYLTAKDTCEAALVEFLEKWTKV